MLVRRLFLTVFCGLRNLHFQCYCGQLKFNRIVLVLKLLSMTSYIIVKSLVQIPFVESSLWRIQMLVRRRSLTVFCGLRKVRFQCYCVQIKFNRIFLVLKLLSTTFYIIVETLAQIPFVEASLWRFKKLFRRPFLTVFCGLRQVRFHCYCAQFKFNRFKWLFEGHLSQFLRITQSTFPMLLCSVQVQSNFSCAQTTFNDLFHHR